jgi:hypothetical protein
LCRQEAVVCFASVATIQQTVRIEPEMRVMMIPIDSIVVPVPFQRLCANWHGGMDCMLYAVCSTGNLTTGTYPPRGCDSDEQWYLTIWRGLASDLGCTVRQAQKAFDADCMHPDDYDDIPELAEFEDWVDDQVIRLERSYGLADWDACDD